MVVAAKPIQSHPEMLTWQYKMLLAELQQLELHASGDCPCILSDLDPPEKCVGKHSLNVFSLAAETARMDHGQAAMLRELADEADALHDEFKDFICHQSKLPELELFARKWRKRIEPVYYACPVKVRMKAPPIVTWLQGLRGEKGEQSKMFTPISKADLRAGPRLNIRCGRETCTVKVMPPIEKRTLLFEKTVPFTALGGAVKEAEALLETQTGDSTAAPPLPPVAEPVAETPPSTAVAVEPVKELPPLQADYIGLLKYSENTFAYPIELGAMLKVPIYESHKRGKNWLAVIKPDPSKPGGLERTFLPHGHGQYYYIVKGLKPGDAVEFGADYYSGAGHKQAERWYGVVAAITGDMIYLVKTETSARAFRLQKDIEPYTSTLMGQPTVCESLARAVSNERNAGDAYRGIAFAAKNEGMPAVSRALKLIANVEDRHRDKLEGLQAPAPAPTALAEAEKANRVVYHYSDEPIQTFIGGKGASGEIPGFFSDVRSRKLATKFGSYITPAQVNIRHPLVLKKYSTNIPGKGRTIKEWLDIFKQHGIEIERFDFDNELLNLNSEEDDIFYWSFLDSDKGIVGSDNNILQILKEAGYDGIIAVEEGLPVRVPFSSEQVVSLAKPVAAHCDVAPMRDPILSQIAAQVALASPSRCNSRCNAHVETP